MGSLCAVACPTSRPSHCHRLPTLPQDRRERAGPKRDSTRVNGKNGGNFGGNIFFVTAEWPVISCFYSPLSHQTFGGHPA